MAVRVSRRKLAAHAAGELSRGNMAVLSELAAFLIESRRTHEADLLAHDIETELAHRGTVVATVASAQPLTDVTRQEVTSVITRRYKDATVHLNEIIDPSLIGGVVIRTPQEEMDASIKSALSRLKASNIKEN